MKLDKLNAYITEIKQDNSRSPLPLRGSASLIALIYLSGCAGPATPLGAVWTLKPLPKPVVAESSSIEEPEPVDTEVAKLNRGPASIQIHPVALLDSPPRIQFSPARQVLHGASPFKITIEDLSGEIEKHKLTIRYNGYDVSKTFLRRARVSIDRFERKITIENPRIRLSPASDHFIEVTYRNSQGNYAYARYGSPSCYAFRPKSVLSLAGFSAPPNLLQLIEEVSKRKGINPAFSTGLVAQESGFNPQAVSWAKAVGLTQVTAIAESEVLKENSDWPQYPQLNELSVIQLKALIMSGKVNAQNEWRLHPEHSVQGGLAYITYLAKRWSSPENLEKIRKLFRDPEAAQTQLILASYQSGYSRVASALDERGKKWLQDDGLTEARKYVNRIFSFCDHFSEQEVHL